MKWFVSQNGETGGPIDDATVREWVTSGKIGPEAFLRDEAASGWAPLAQTPFAPAMPPRVPAAQANEPLPPKVVQPSGTSLGFQLTLAVIGGAVLVAVALTALASNSNSRSDPPPPPPLPTASPATDPSMPWAISETYVKGILKSPSTASFGGSSEYQDPKDCCTLLADGAWRCAGFVDSQNSFGAKLRAQFSVTVKRTFDGNWTAVSGPTLREQ